MTRLAACLLAFTVSFQLPAAHAVSCANYAIEPKPFTVSDQPVSDVAVSGTNLFAASTSTTTGLAVVDISHAAAPSLVTAIDPGAPAHTLHLDGTWLYVGTTIGIAVVDVSTPGAPSVSTTIPAAFTVEDVAVSGTRLYAVGGHDLLIADVTTPSSPSTLSTTAFPLSSQSPSIVEAMPALPNHILVQYYSGGGWGAEDMRAVDVTDPANPLFLQAVVIRNGDQFSGPPDAHVAVQGTLVVTSCDGGTPTTNTAGAEVWDFSTPGAPVSLGTEWILADSYGSHLLFWDTDDVRWMVASVLRGPATLDVSNPSSPLATVPPVRFPLRVVSPVRTGNLLAAGGGNGIVVFDPAVPAGIQPIGSASLGDGYLSVADVAVSGDLALVAQWDSVQAFDVTDRTNPTPLGGYPLANNDRIVEESGVGYVLHDQSLTLLDVTGPGAPAFHSSLGLGGAAIDVAASAGFAHVIASDDYVYVDASVPTAASEVGRLTMGSAASSGAVSFWNGHAYLVDGSLHRIAPGPVPTVLASASVSGSTYGVTVESGRAFVVGLVGLHVFDVTGAPTSTPTQVGFLALPTRTRSVEVHGETAYVTSPGSVSLYLSGVVYVIDISDPAVPTLVEEYGTAVSRCSPGSEFLAAAGVAGLQLLPLQCESSAIDAPLGGALQTTGLRVAPNPFRSATRLSFSLDRGGMSRVIVYDVAGRRIATLQEGFLAAGLHSVEWSGTTRSGAGLPPGVYFVEQQVGARRSSTKVVRTR